MDPTILGRLNVDGSGGAKCSVQQTPTLQSHGRSCCWPSFRRVSLPDRGSADVALFVVSLDEQPSFNCHPSLEMSARRVATLLISPAVPQLFKENVLQRKKRPRVR